jgi:hypothetical protein
MMFTHEEVTASSRKFHNEDLHNLCSNFIYIGNIFLQNTA